MMRSPCGKSERRSRRRKSPSMQPRRELRVVSVEVGDALRVDLGAPRQDVFAPQQELRQYPHAASHLKHVAAPCGGILLRGRAGGLCGGLPCRQQHGTARERIADLAGNIQIDQEMLAQGFFGSNFRHTRQRYEKNPPDTHPADRLHNRSDFRPTGRRPAWAAGLPSDGTARQAAVSGSTRCTSGAFRSRTGPAGGAAALNVFSNGASGAWLAAPRHAPRGAGVAA